MQPSGRAQRGSRAAQWYGYTVCLVAVITTIFSVRAIVDASFEIADPLRAEGRFAPSFRSYEAYRATLDRFPIPPMGADTSRRAPSEAELRRRYEALRADRLEQARFDATRSLVTNGILLAFAVGLFLWHWSWLRRTGAESPDELAPGAPFAR